MSILLLNHTPERLDGRCYTGQRIRELVQSKNAEGFEQMLEQLEPEKTYYVFQSPMWRRDFVNACVYMGIANNPETGWIFAPNAGRKTSAYYYDSRTVYGHALVIIPASETGFAIKGKWSRFVPVFRRADHVLFTSDWWVNHDSLNGGYHIAPLKEEDAKFMVEIDEYMRVYEK